MEPLVLAVIEDENTHFDLMKRAIVRDLKNVSVFHFIDPQACLDDLPKIKPTVIITDYLMPGMNGIELIGALNQKNLDVPVIMITGQGDENIAVHAMRLGAKDYLVKSGKFFDLLPKVIEKVINEKKISDALRKLEERYRLVMENADEGIMMIQDGNLLLCNPKMADIMGYSQEELMGSSLLDYVYSEDQQTMMEIHQSGQSGDKDSQIYEFRIIDKSHNLKWLRNHEVYTKWDNKPAVLNFVTDISALKKADEHIYNLSQMLLQAQERERQMISYELHDHTLQNLSSLKIDLDMLFDDYSDTSPELWAKSKKMSALSRQIIKDIRNMAYELHPPSLEELGLVKALASYCDEFSENSGIRVNFQSAGMQTFNVDANAAIHFYRLVQEGLNNIRKHASAGRATVKLMGAYPNILLRIEDNGKGFNVEEYKPALDNQKRMGFRSMQERVNLLQGQMMIQSTAMQGTKIFIKIPLRTGTGND